MSIIPQQPPSQTAPWLGAETPAEEWLVAQCRQGDERAWRELVRRYRGLVMAVPRRIGLREEQAADVFQNVFVALIESLPTMRDPTALPKWLITTAVRQSHRVLRADAHGESGSLPIEAPAIEATPELDDLETRHLIHRALERLSDPCRSLLVELYCNGERPGYSQASKRLRIPVGSIGPTRARCLAQLLREARRLGVIQ